MGTILIAMTIFQIKAVFKNEKPGRCRPGSTFFNVGRYDRCSINGTRTEPIELHHSQWKVLGCPIVA